MDNKNKPKGKLFPIEETTYHIEVTKEKDINVWNENYNKTGKWGKIAWRLTKQTVKGAMKITGVCVKLAGIGVVSLGRLIMLHVKKKYPKDETMRVGHKDGDPLNHKPKNLRWEQHKVKRNDSK